jgi:hypothetical protein
MAWSDPEFIRPVRPDDLINLDGLSPTEYQAQLNGQDPDPVPEPKPFRPAVTRTIIAAIGLMFAGCAWLSGGVARNTGIAFALLFLCAAILPRRR